MELLDASFENVPEVLLVVISHDIFQKKCGIGGRTSSGNATSIRVRPCLRAPDHSLHGSRIWWGQWSTNCVLSSIGDSGSFFQPGELTFQGVLTSSTHFYSFWLILTYLKNIFYWSYCFHLCRKHVLCQSPIWQNFAEKRPSEMPAE